jgi:hypothetical protein
MILHFEKLSSICSMLMYDGIGIMTFEQEKGSFENVHGNLDFGRWPNRFIYNLPIYVRGESIVTYMLAKSFAQNVNSYL